MSDDTLPDPDRIGYAEALAELEQILARLERDDVDVDVLSAQVERAAALIRTCRTRIQSTRVEVERIVADLDHVDDEPDDD